MLRSIPHHFALLLSNAQGAFEPRIRELLAAYPAMPADNGLACDEQVSPNSARHSVVEMKVRHAYALVAMLRSLVLPSVSVPCTAASDQPWGARLVPSSRLRKRPTSATGFA